MPDHCVLDLELEQGEIVAFLGPNGAGKTTTIDMVLGLSRPTSGEVSVLGLAPRQAIARGLVSAVMQTGGLLKDLTVRETVAYTASLFADTRPVDEVLDDAGNRQLLDRSGILVEGLDLDLEPGIGGRDHAVALALVVGDPLLPASWRDPEAVDEDDGVGGGMWRHRGTSLPVR